MFADSHIWWSNSMNANKVILLLQIPSTRLCQSYVSTFSKGRHPAGIYLFKANNGNARSICEICSEFTIRALERRQ